MNFMMAVMVWTLKVYRFVLILINDLLNKEVL